MKSFIQRKLLDTVYGRPRDAAAAFDASKIRRVLVIRRNGLGDMICTLPLIRNIRTGWPLAKIDVLAGEANAGLLQGISEIHHVHLYLRGTGIYRNHYLNLPRVLEPIRREAYDLVIAVKGGFSPLLATVVYATGIPWRLGYLPSRGHSMGFCYNLHAELPLQREHQVESCLRLLDPLGIAKTSCDLSFPLSSDQTEYAEEILKRFQVALNSFVLFNLSSERHESRWIPGAIAQTARELEKRFSLPMILCGLKKDQQMLDQTHHLAGSAIRGSVTPPSIHHFAALTRQSRFLMCGDGGPMHVGAAMKTPVFALFSATDPEIWRPYGVPFEQAHHGRFVADISASEVIEKVGDWLPSLKT